MYQHVRIVSWNILSCNLFDKMKEAHPDVYGHLTNEDRWTQILGRLRGMIGLSSIIVLQEVTLSRYHSSLVPLCASTDYGIRYVSYGNDFDGYMGTAILFPEELYYELHYHSFRLGMGCTPGSPGRTLSNHLLCLCLYQRSTGTIFGVVGYHMPCKPKKPEIQQDHWKAIKQLATTIDIPVLIAADMNMYEKDIPLVSIVGPKDDDYVAIPLKPVLESIWSFCPSVPTTRSIIHTHEFQGCIDYIFTCNNNHDEDEMEKKIHWIEQGISEDDNNAWTSLLPNVIHPSDHIPIYSTLCLRFLRFAANHEE